MRDAQGKLLDSFDGGKIGSVPHALRSDLAWEAEAAVALKHTVGAYGLSLSYNKMSKQLSVSCHGKPCSKTNRSILVMSSTIGDGSTVQLIVDVATHAFISGSSSAGIIDPMGTAVDKAWSAPRPMFLYAINGDDTDAGLRFSISPSPTAEISPGVAQIGWIGTAASQTTGQLQVVLSNEDPRKSHSNKPILRIGGLEMTRDNNLAWRVVLEDDALPGRVGVGRYPNIARQYTFPTATMGAAPDSYFLDNSVVDNKIMPMIAHSLSRYRYQLKMSGAVSVVAVILAKGGTKPAGVLRAQLAIPYRMSESYDSNVLSGTGVVTNNQSTPLMVLAVRIIPDTKVPRAEFARFSAADVGNLTHDDLTSDGQLDATLEYQAFTNP